MKFASLGRERASVHCVPTIDRLRLISRDLDTISKKVNKSTEYMCQVGGACCDLNSTTNRKNI